MRRPRPKYRIDPLLAIVWAGVFVLSISGVAAASYVVWTCYALWKML